MGLGKNPAVASGRWRSEAGRGGRQSQVMWRIGRRSAGAAGWGVWWVRVTVLQEMGRWAQMEIWVWRTFCCTPEAWECTGCFQKLNPTSTDRPRSRTRQHKKGGGRQKEGKKAGKVAAIVHTGGKDIRSGERKGRREGGKREGADEAGKTSKKLYSSFYLGVLPW